MSLLADAQRWHDAGCSIIPVRADGSKQPLVAWKMYQTTRPTIEELRGWFGGEHPGMGVITGAVSGNLELVEFEGRAMNEGDTFAQFLALLTEHDPELCGTVFGSGNYVQRSPSGGLHLIYRVSGPIDGNTKLAEVDTPQGRRPLIETRGEGGYFILAPSHGRVHPTGEPWIKVSGSPGTIVTLTPEQRDLIHALARELTQVVPPVRVDPKPQQRSAQGQETPGEDFNRRATWAEILEPHGWTFVNRVGVRQNWRHPDKNFGSSARADDYFWCWSSTASNVPTEEAISKWRLYTMLNFGNTDQAFSDAARQLRHDGYGGERMIDVQPALATLTTTVTMDGEMVIPDPAEARFLMQVQHALYELKVREKAKELLRQDNQTVSETAYDSVNLTALLDEPNEERQYLVENLWPEGGRILLAAQYKAGKTTLTGNLARCLVDGSKFLDTYTIDRRARIGMVDTEMTRDMVRDWLRAQEIKNTGDINIWPLRGQVNAFNLLDDTIRAKWATRLRDLGVDVLVFDCLRPVLDVLGLSEDHEGGRFLVHFDALLHEANIKQGLVIQHMGHGEPRARGDSRFRDWPDVEWKIVRDDDNPGSTRYFSAYGRDVNVPECELFHNSANRHLSIVGGGREDGARNNIITLAHEILTRTSSPMSQNKLTTAVYDCSDYGKTVIEKTLKGLNDKRFTIIRGTRGRASTYQVREYRDYNEVSDD